VGDAFYFQALALYRIGGPARMEQALELLAEQAARYPDAATAEDARALQVRAQSELARRGDAVAAAQVARSASAGCDQTDQGVRATALSALLQMDAEQAMPILREVLRQRDECSTELRKQAVFLVSQKMTDETVDVLVDLAQRNPDPDPEVREAAIFWLSQTPNEGALDALLSILESGGTDEQVQERVVFAVAQHRSPRAAEVLRNYARNASAPVELRANAIFWLGQQGGADAGGFLRELYGSLQDPELKDRVLFSVSQSHSADNRTWLLARARDTRESIDIRKKALFWAGQAGLSAQEALEVYRSATDRDMKEQALFVLTQVQEGRSQAVDGLMEIARTEQDGELRQRAIFWLGQSNDPRAAELLLQIIRGGGG
jgi:HEAT repeat protein